MKPKSFSVALVCGRSEITNRFSAKIRRQKNEKSKVGIRRHIGMLLDGYGF
jgi:hypothetical protein